MKRNNHAMLGKILDLLTLLTEIITILVALWFVIWMAVGDSVAYLGYINALGFLFALATAACAIFLAARKKWVWAAFAAMLAAILWTMGSGINFGAGQQSRPKETIRIISASLRGLNKNMDAAALQLAKYDADIIAAQEASNAEQLVAALSKHSGKKWFLHSSAGYSILSRYPVGAPAKVHKYWGSAQIKLNGKSIILWTLHAPKAFSRPIENRVYFTDLVDMVRAERPDIVLGDFNATPWNFGYHIMSKSMTSAHGAAGFGPGNSFPAPGRRSGLLGAFSRIDHIFVDKRHIAANAFTGRASAGADHHPVIADIEFISR